MGIELRPDPKPVRAVKDPKRLKTKPKPKSSAVKADAAAWRIAVLSKRTAMVWTAEDYPLIAAGTPIRMHCHHAISAQECRKHGVPEWDRRNGVPVSERRHARHHSRIEPLDRSELPDEIFAFLADYPALLPYFNRMYPEGTPRDE